MEQFSFLKRPDFLRRRAAAGFKGKGGRGRGLSALAFVLCPGVCNLGWVSVRPAVRSQKFEGAVTLGEWVDWVRLVEE